jgi:signal transduction histidine kinase/CheY-like chemotaxis protein
LQPVEPSIAPLDDILITPLLMARPAPSRDVAAELAALTNLIACAATDPAQLLPRVVELAVNLCRAGSAGVSLLEPHTASTEGAFRWVAMAGKYREYVGGSTPEAFSPCGTCLLLGASQLYRYPAKRFTYLSQAHPPIVEGLVLPLRSASGPMGTIWIVSHDEPGEFTATDLEVMTSLADFTSTALALLRAREEAEAGNRAKDEFLAIVSHELRRPLTAIVGWSELLLAGRATPATAARAIQALYANARRQQDMIEDLLDASRALTGTLRLHERRIDLAEVVRAALEVVAGDTKQKGITLSVDVADAIPLHGDPDRLHQVIGNLLTNAVKFTPAGGRISVAVAVASPSVEISVCDTGIGIPPHMLTQIFEPFSSADASSTRRNSGLGLGLSIAARLAALHDGTIEAFSEGEGRGARFTVRVPVTRLLTSADERPAAAPRTPRRDHLADIAILVVDDEPDVREVLACVLEDAGASVSAAEGVESALSSMAERPFDVLVTDLVMPGQDGYDLLASLDQNTSLYRPRATIAVTALASARERQRILAAGFDHHLAKPVDFDDLVGLIARLMSGGATVEG